MAEPYTPILATLGYVLSADGQRVLMMHRNQRACDAHYGKYNGLGGKLDPGEDVVSGMRREIREEAGIDVKQLRLAGTVSWPGFGASGEDWFGFIFVAGAFSGTPNVRCPEGTLEWVELDSIVHLNLWEGDRKFLPLVFADPPREFHGVMPYADGVFQSWHVSFTDQP